MKKLLNLFYVFFPLILGSIVGFVINGNIQYNTFIKPPLAPPSILFPIVWTILYLLMGISYYLYKQEYQTFTKVDIVYYLQLFINILWSIIFFIFKAYFFSVIWIILLDIFVILLISLFWNRKRISSYLNIPYLLWILFATYLTIGIWILN